MQGPINFARISDADRDRFRAMGRAALIAFNHARALPPERLKQNRREYEREHRDYINAAERVRYKQATDDLHDRYVRRNIYHCTGVAPSKIPPEIVEAKRQILLIKRFLKENEK